MMLRLHNGTAIQDVEASIQYLLSTSENGICYNQEKKKNVDLNKDGPQR